MQDLYAPMIERDLAAIPEAVRRFRAAHSTDELFVAVARFAVLAFAPSQHARHALLACLAAHDLQEECEGRFDDLLTECAVYAASSRQPWSEPPIGDPPPADPDQRRDRGELRMAIESKDRLRGERWLAARLNDDGLARDLFEVASEDLEDLGHKLIVATASWKLAALLGVRGRYAALRPAVVELTAYRGLAVHQEHGGLDEATLLDRLIALAVFEKGSLVDVHKVFLLSSALEASELAADPQIALRICDYLTAGIAECPAGDDLPPAPAGVPIYSLARDYGQSLQAHAIAKRLRSRFPSASFNRLIDAAHYNLEHGPSFEEFSFA